MNKSCRFDYVIFGSGAAGSTVARELSRSNSVAIVDIAEIRSSDKKERRIPPFVNSTSSFYSPAYSDVFGGNTNLWSNKIYLLAKGETKNWPIDHDELLKYSKSTSR